MNIGLFSLLFFLLVSSIGFIFALINYKLLNNDEIYQQEEIDVITVNKTAFDVLFDLQSMYGFVKVREIVNSKNLDFIIVNKLMKKINLFSKIYFLIILIVKKWLANDVSIYENLKNQLAEEGVYLCEFKNLNLKLITQDDFDLFNKILGEGSSVSDIIKPGYYDIFKVILQI